MAKRRPPWYVDRNSPPLPYAFFISHVSEDSDAVNQLKSEIEGLSGKGGRAPLRCFLDLRNWQIGNDLSGVIKEFLLKCEYMVVWATPAYLDTKRGWIWIELGYAQLLELSLNISDLEIRTPYIVPIFQDLNVSQIERTPLLGYWQRKLLTPGEEPTIPEIAQRLVDFYDQEAAKRRGP